MTSAKDCLEQIASARQAGAGMEIFVALELQATQFPDYADVRDDIYREMGTYYLNIGELETAATFMRLIRGVRTDQQRALDNHVWKSIQKSSESRPFSLPIFEDMLAAAQPL